MYKKNINLIDKKLVHKQKDENIFICDVRKMLPRKIETNIFEDNIAKSVSPEEYKYLRQFYVLSENSTDKHYYVLRTCTSEIKNYMEVFFESSESNAQDRKYLVDFVNTPAYKCAEGSGCILADEISEVVETKILNILNLRNLHISELDRMRMFNILKSIDGVTWTDDIFYSRMHVNTSHPFFFEHPNEHVPGIMLVEALRQFGIACSHSFCNVPCKGVQFVLSDMKVSFNGYLEINFPIRFEGIVNSTKYNKSGFLTYSDFKTIVYQRNEAMASATTIGKNIPDELFNLLRRNNQFYKQLPRFKLREGISVKFYLQGKELEEHGAELVNFSQDGFCIRGIEGLINRDMEVFNLSTPFGRIGYPDGRCKLAWQKAMNGSTYYGFKIIYLEESEREILNEVFKRFCYICEEREIL
jgi:hypothetical protein